MGTVRIRPAAPLVPVNWAQVSRLIGPFVPNANAIFLEVSNVGVSLEEPKQFMDDGTQVQLLRREHWKSFTQVKPHLIPKTADSPCPRAVLAQRPIRQNMIQ